MEKLSRSQKMPAMAVALVITFAARAIPDWDFCRRIMDYYLEGLSRGMRHSLILLGLGLLLALSAPRASGLIIGDWRAHWKKILLVCGLPVLVAAIIYPQLNERPFAGANWSMWAISPLAQDLVFGGFLYGYFEKLYTAEELRQEQKYAPLLLTCTCFALWHVPNLGGMSAGFLVFQLFYTFLGLFITGLTRVWTGSLLYLTLAHAGVNFIAWWAN